MSLRSLLYWIDRAFNGDRRPIWFAGCWLLMVLVIAMGMFMYER